MSYVTTINALIVRLKTLDSTMPVLRYAPSALHQTPAFMVFLGSVAIVDKGQVPGARYSAVIRLAVAWQDFAEAEALIEPFVDSVPALLRADRHLGLTGSTAPVAEIEDMTIEAGWIEIAGVTYRTVDFTVPILDKQVG